MFIIYPCILANGGRPRRFRTTPGLTWILPGRIPEDSIHRVSWSWLL